MSEQSLSRKLKSYLTLHNNYKVKPFGFKFRSNTLFIVSTVGVGLFTDLFLYGLVVPILPFILSDRIGLPTSQIQNQTSALLASYAGASVVLSPIAGLIADRTSSRQAPFLAGLFALIVATVLLFTGSSIAILTIARVAQGASSAFVWTVGLALCLDTVGPENLGKTIGSIFSFISVGGFAAPTVGGVLWRTSGVKGTLGVSIAVIAVDLVMRVLVIEKKVARRYEEQDPNGSSSRSTRDDTAEEHNDGQAADDDDAENNEEDGQPTTADESSPLLKKNKPSHTDSDTDSYRLSPPSQQPWLLRHVPILLCFRSPSLHLAFLIALTQALFLSSFDATVPTQASDLYGFDSLRSGLLFLPLGIFDLLLGPLAGWAVDKYGTKVVAVAGYTWLVPAFVLLRLPRAEPFGKNIAIYCVILALNGIGLAVIGAPSIVEAGAVVDKFAKRNPENFEVPPYASLYAFNSMIFSAGLAIGPLVAGALRERFGYGNANAVLAGISGVTAVLSYMFLAGKPKAFGGKGTI